MEISILHEIIKKYNIEKNDKKWLEMIYEEIRQKNHEITELKATVNAYKKFNNHK